MPEPWISAIICTHNRDVYLGEAIDSLLDQDFPGEYEIIIVNNASSDRTREVVEERLPHPRLQYVYEPQVGLSVARNTGALVARSPILAYLDDDAVATRRWLQVLYQAYQDDDRLAVAGGKVTLLWHPPLTPPPWLSSSLAGNLGAYDLGDAMVYIDRPGLTPRGLNYSIRRAFLDQVGGFDLKLGRVGKNLLSNEELHMTELALGKGWRVAYLPDALVAHTVAPERLHQSWFMNRSWWQGISECYRERLKGQPTHLQLRQGLERMARGLYRSLKFLPDPAQRFDNFVYAYGQVGYLMAVIQSLVWPFKEMKRSS